MTTQVYITGSARAGISGQAKGETLHGFRPVSGTKDAVHVSVGGNFVAALTSTGQLLTWGMGSKGRLGHGNEEDSHIPRKVNLPSPVKLVAAGKCVDVRY